MILSDQIQIKCKELVLGYNGKAITQKLNFSVKRGDYLSIVGENGSGKSTLVKTILKIIPPLSGEIESFCKIHKSDIGYLPQQAETQLDFPATVNEIVLSGCVGKGLFHSKEEKNKAFENMNRLGIYELKNKSLRELSGGQKQRVFLARALCSAHGILLLDEPDSGLDPAITNELYDLLYNLNTKEKITIILVSHDLSSALKYSSKILHIGGDEQFFGTVDEYKTSNIGKNFINN